MATNDPNPFSPINADVSSGRVILGESERFDSANRPLLQPNEAAPDDYYQNNCIEVFDFVLAHHQALLPTELQALCSSSYRQMTALNGFLRDC